MDQRFKLWLVITLGLFILNGLITSWLFPPQPKPAEDKAKVVAQAEPGDAEVGDAEKPAAEQANETAEEPKVEVEKEPAVEDDAARTKHQTRLRCRHVGSL